MNVAVRGLYAPTGLCALPRLLLRVFPDGLAQCRARGLRLSVPLLIARPDRGRPPRGRPRRAPPRRAGRRRLGAHEDGFAGLPVAPARPEENVAATASTAARGTILPLCARHRPHPLDLYVHGSISTLARLNRKRVFFLRLKRKKETRSEDADLSYSHTVPSAACRVLGPWRRGARGRSVRRSVPVAFLLVTAPVLCCVLCCSVLLCGSVVCVYSV